MISQLKKLKLKCLEMEAWNSCVLRTDSGLEEVSVSPKMDCDSGVDLKIVGLKESLAPQF